MPATAKLLQIIEKNIHDELKTVIREISGHFKHRWKIVKCL